MSSRGHRGPSRGPVLPHPQRGAATVLLVGVLGVLMVAGAAAVMVGTAATASHRAAAAADLAALAAAVVLRDSGSASQACAAARHQAERNGAGVVSCATSDGAAVSVRCSVPTRLHGPGLPHSVARAARAGPVPGDG